ncbi:MAG: iron-sulfur cluster assembly accessory protein [Gemmatimonadota bacterium]
MQIQLTDQAIEKVKTFIEEHGAGNGSGLRVAVLPGGCSGFQYGLNIEDAPETDDEILDAEGIRVFVDPFSAQYLEGTEIDYVTSMMGSGFTFKNPSAAGGCGCGSSFTV